MEKVLLFLSHISLILNVLRLKKILKYLCTKPDNGDIIFVLGDIYIDSVRYYFVFILLYITRIIFYYIDIDEIP